MPRSCPSRRCFFGTTGRRLAHIRARNQSAVSRAHDEAADEGEHQEGRRGEGEWAKNIEKSTGSSRSSTPPAAALAGGAREDYDRRGDRATLEQAPPRRLVARRDPADGRRVGAHVSILSLASPVLERMLSSAMVEAISAWRRDTPKAAMELFLESAHRLREHRGGGRGGERRGRRRRRRLLVGGGVRRRRRPLRRDRRARARAPVEHGRRPRASRTCWPRSSPTTTSASAEAATCGTRASSTRASRTPRARPRQAAADAGEYSAAVLELLGSGAAGEPSRKKRRAVALTCEVGWGSEHRVW